jgi:hypothetical protein
MTELINKIHMDVSYNVHSVIYDYVERKVSKTKTFLMDKKLLIGTNRSNQIDTTLLFLTDKKISKNKKNQNHKISKQWEDTQLNKQYLINNIKGMEKKEINKYKTLWTKSSLETNMKHSMRFLKKSFTNKTEYIINKFVEEYSKLLDIKDIIDIVKWIYEIYVSLNLLINDKIDDKIDDKIYDKIYDETNEYDHDGSLFAMNFFVDSETKKLIEDYGDVFVGVYHFLSNLEWFHMLVTYVMCKDIFSATKSTNPDKYAVIFGERNMIEYEFINTYTLTELKNLFSSEYISHSILYIVGNDLIYMYDPDESDDEELDPTDAIAYILDFKKNTTQNENKIEGQTKMQQDIQLVQLCPVQSLTDDQYCIFHCIWFLLRLIGTFDGEMTLEKFSKFIEHINKINKKTTIKDVRYFIMELYETALLYLTL